MAKHPVPGRVKTRLARTIGAAAAAALSAALARDLARRLAPLPYAVTWAVWPPDAPFDGVVAGARCIPQRGADLGDRMANAIAALLAERPGPVLLLGADVAHLDLAVLDAAGAALASGAEVVLGPALDGGYYLIGTATLRRELFADVVWGRGDVLAVTLARTRALGLRVHLLPATFDVDEPADLERLREVIARGGVSLPATAAVLDALPSMTG